MAEVLRFVENGLMYKLPWGMEAVRVRAQVNQDEIEGITIDDFQVDLAVPAVETGTLNRSASILMQAGFTSRLAAIKAIIDTEAEFTNAYELSTWLRSDTVIELTRRGDWPTPEFSNLWKTFTQEYSSPERTVWSVKHTTRAVQWVENLEPPPETHVKVHNENGSTLLLSATYELLGMLDPPINQNWTGLLLARTGQSSSNVNLTYYGPNDIDLE